MLLPTASVLDAIPEFSSPHSDNRKPSKANQLRSSAQYKQPRSIQVVVYAGNSADRRYLLLKRLEDHGGFWQSVTGSLEEGESHREAALREVFEETGLPARAEDLIELGVVNTFEIAPQWRAKYAPGVTHNEEVCFALPVEQQEVRLDPLEHVSHAWEPYDRAIRMLYWESTRRAFATTQSILG